MSSSWILSRSGWILLLDTFFAGLSFAVALWLRLGDDLWVYAKPYFAMGMLISVVMSLPVAAQLRQAQAMWRYVSLRDVLTLIQSAFATVTLTYAALFVLQRLVEVPRSAPLVQFLVLVALLVTPRMLYRATREGHLGLSKPPAPEKPRTPMLLVGTGSAAEQFVRDLERNPNATYHAVGFLSADPTRVGQRIHGVPIYGPASQLDKVLARLNVTPELLALTDPEMPGEKVREWLDLAEAHGLTLARLPHRLDLPKANAPLALKPVAVEDLLGRPQAALDRDSMAALISGKRVLITGAGGTIGGELARQVVGFGPAALTLLDISEYALYQIEQEMLRLNTPGVPVYCMLGDVRDRGRLEQVFAFQKPEIVLHAAAIKHVPIAERDCEEAVLTNVFGTQHVAECCLANGTEAMVVISTDKAVEPSNIMGATKRLAERYILWLSKQRAAGGTLFLAVRFGNVLGSTGSVVPLFRRQLEAGGPLTVTHPDMTRYFMTVHEAVELVLQAAAIGVRSPESTRGRIFVLDMGDAMKIDDLARRMIQLAGLRLGRDIEISYSGIRPGEKLEEALFYEEEVVGDTAHESILLAEASQVDVANLAEGLVELEEACLNRDREQAFALLQQLVPEYAPYGWAAAA